MLSTLVLLVCTMMPPINLAGGPPHYYFSILGCWETPSISYEIVDPTPDSWKLPGKSIKHFRKTVLKAMLIWESTGLVKFKPALGNPPDLRIEWVPAKHDNCQSFKGWDGGQAHSGPPEKGTFIHFNQNASWRVSRPGVDSLLSTALHELGHIIGLGHTHDPGSIMYGAYNPNSLSIGPLDRAALKSLYGKIPSKVDFDAPPGEQLSSNILLCKFDSEGVATPICTSLVGIAPADFMDFGLFSLKKGDKASLLTWPKKNSAYIGIASYHFRAIDAGKALRLASMQGPLPGFLNTRYSNSVGLTKKLRPIFVNVYPDKMYSAMVIEPNLRKSRSFKKNRAFEMNTGLADFDGDGYIDQNEYIERRLKDFLPKDKLDKVAQAFSECIVVASADINSDKKKDFYIQEESGEASTQYRWLISTNEAGNKWKLGPSLIAERVSLGDLIGDSIPEVAIRLLGKQSSEK